MTELKLLAALMQLKIKNQSVRRYIPILLRMSNAFQILSPELLKKFKKTHISTWADFKMFWKKNFPTDVINEEAYTIKETLMDIKTEFREIRKLSQEALYEYVHEQIVSIGMMQIAGTATDSNPTDYADALYQLNTHVTALKDLELGNLSINQLNIADPYEYKHFRQQQEILKKTRKTFCVTTGFPTLDAFLGGGQQSRRVGIVMALPKRFKTSLSLSFLIKTFLKGHSVTMISLENVVEDTDAKINLISAVSKLQKIKKENEYDNYFDVLYRPPFTFTLNDLRLYLEEKRKKNKLPSVIVVDFLDLMGSEEKNQQDWVTQHHIIYGLKGIVNEFNVFIWALSQGNRDGASSPSLGIQHMGRDFSRIAGADYILSLNQSKTEKAHGILKIMLLEGRWTNWQTDVRTDRLMLKLRSGSLMFKEITPAEQVEVNDTKKKKLTQKERFEKLQKRKR